MKSVIDVAATLGGWLFLIQNDAGSMLFSLLVTGLGDPSSSDT